MPAVSTDGLFKFFVFIGDFVMSFIVSVTRSITLMLLGLGTCLLWDYQALTFAQDLFEGCLLYTSDAADE